MNIFITKKKNNKNKEIIIFRALILVYDQGLMLKF